MHLLGRQQTLSIYAPPGLKELMDKLNKVSETKLNFPIQWHETSQGTSKMLFEDDKVEVYSFPLQHRIHCTGFLFREKKHPRKIDKYKLEKNKVSTADIQLLRHGMDVVNADGELIKNAEVTIDPLPPRSFAYCSDTRYNEEVCSYIQGVDLLYHESTFLDDQAPRAAKTFHSTAKQAADIALKAGAKQLLLGHFSARYRVLDDFIKEASEIYPNCVLASDGKLIKI